LPETKTNTYDFMHDVVKIIHDEFSDVINQPKFQQNEAISAVDSALHAIPILTSRIEGHEMLAGFKFLIVDNLVEVLNRARLAKNADLQALVHEALELLTEAMKFLDKHRQ
jgi:hypothetical protein